MDISRNPPALEPDDTSRRSQSENARGKRRADESFLQHVPNHHEAHKDTDSGKHASTSTQSDSMPQSLEVGFHVLNDFIIR